MADERRKGVPDRRRSRATNPAQTGEKATTSTAGTPEVQASEEQRARNRNEAAAFDADQLDASIRARAQEDRGEVF